EPTTASLRVRHLDVRILRRGVNESADGVAQRLRLGQMLELLQRVVLDLADALACDAEGAADLLERLRRPAVQAEAQRDHLALAQRQRVERAPDVLGTRGQLGPG